MGGFDTYGDPDLIGDIFSDILKTGAAVAESEIEAHQAGEREAKTRGDEATKLEAAKAKDAQAAVAIAHAIVSGALSAKTADSDRAFADKSLSEAKAARAGLSADSEENRAGFARAQLDQAKARAQAAPKDGYKAALVTGWSKVSEASAAGGSDGKKPAESWLTRRVLGPVPGYGVLAGAGVLLLIGAKIFMGRK